MMAATPPGLGRRKVREPMAFRVPDGGEHQT
jgi:hypothetical protein